MEEPRRIFFRNRSGSLGKSLTEPELSGTQKHMNSLDINNFTNKTIFNISNYDLNVDELDLLNKGIKFVPSKQILYPKQIETSLKRFIRSLKLIDVFKDTNRNPDLFRIPSTWEPDTALLSTNTINLITIIHNKFYEIMNKFKLNKPFVTYKTLNKRNIKSNNIILNIQNNKSITIRKADKGSSFVIMNTKEYTSEAYRQLNDAKFYKKLTEPLHPKNATVLNEIIKNAFKRHLINYKTANFLMNNGTYNTRKFYILPKIHKEINKWTNPFCPPGRPIISDVKTESSNAAHFIDFYINKHAQKLPSYVKDSFDFVSKLKNITIEKNDLFITGDVNSLYTNMNLNRTVAVIKKLFKNTYDPGRPDELIIKLLDFTLKNNDFEFNNEYFLQTCGCAMGKKYSPGLANLYLESLDRFILNYQNKPKTYLRYLDDIFIIWNDNQSCNIKNFNKEINNLIPDIKIELKTNESSIDFLDVTIIKEPDGSIGTKVFFKETNNRLLLNPNSCHPKHTFSGIVKSQFSRYHRLSSKPEYFLKTCNELINNQMKLGYSRSKMRSILKEFHENKTIKVKEQQPNKTSLLPFIIPYSKTTEIAVREVRKLISENEFFKNYKIMAAFTKDSNLQKLFM